MPFAGAGQAGATSIESRFRAMNTEVHVIVVDGEQALLRRAEAMVRDREARWSRFLHDSELSQVNRHAGRPVVVAPDTFALISDALAAYELTGGVFDPTVLRCLVDAGYDRSFDRLTPDPAAPRRGTARRRGRPVVRSAPGPRGIELDPGLMSIRLPPGTGLDLGGLGKGATADVVTEALMAAGAHGCCVNLGGDVRVRGLGPAGGGWTIELACPGSTDRRLVVLGDGAVCTSTTLKRAWEGVNGSEHHLREPTTGRPFERGVVSVSVIAARALQADILTKTAFAAGSEGASAAIVGYGATGLTVSADGTVQELPGFERFSPTVGSVR